MVTPKPPDKSTTLHRKIMKHLFKESRKRKATDNDVATALVMTCVNVLKMTKISADEFIKNLRKAMS